MDQRQARGLTEGLNQSQGLNQDPMDDPGPTQGLNQSQATYLGVNPTGQSDLRADPWPDRRAGFLPGPQVTGNRISIKLNPKQEDRPRQA